MGFFEKLMTGKRYEDKVADWFESIGFHVWRLGNWRLPIDLLIWKGKQYFCVEVKFRSVFTPFPVKIKERKLWDFLTGKTPIFLIIVHPEDSTVWKLKKRKLSDRKDVIMQLWGGKFVDVDYGYFRYKNLGEYKEVNWNELYTDKE